MYPIRTALVTGAIVLGAFGSAACGAGATDPAGAGTAAAPASAPAVSASARTSRAVRAVRTAVRRVSAGRPYDIESDRFRGRPVWEVKVAAGNKRPHEILVSRNGKRVVHHKRIRPGRDSGQVRNARTGLVRAIRIADRRAPGRFDEAGIDRTHRGTLVWEVNFDISRHREVEVTVSARSGKVLRVDYDD